MERKEKAFLLFIIFSLSTFFLFLGITICITLFPCPNCELKCAPLPDCKPNLTCPPQPDCICHQESCPDLPLFMKEAQNVADAHYWEPEKYMCGDFSIELFKRLKSDGYDDVYICYGKLLKFYDENGTLSECNEKTSIWKCRHAWVKIGKGTSIIFESVNGYVVPPKIYEERYEEIWCYNYLSQDVLNLFKSGKEV